MRLARIVAAAIACGCGRVGFEPVDAGSDPACPGAALDTDPRNCGACGHDCLGGGCEAGACQPVLITGGQVASRSILVDDTYIYWTAAQAIRRADKATRTVETVATFTGTAFRMTAVSGYLYWVTRDTGLVARAAMAANASTETIAMDQGDVGGIDSDGTNVYWTTYPTGKIYAGTVDGATPTEVLTTLTANLTALRLVGSTIYYIEIGAGLRSIPVTGGAPAVVAPGVGTWEFALDGQDVFLANAEPADRVVHTTLSGAATTVLGSVVEPWGIAVDATDVYCANEDGNTISRTSRSGGATEIIATTSQPVGITVDDRTIYWTTYDGAVFLVAK